MTSRRFFFYSNWKVTKLENGARWSWQNPTKGLGVGNSIDWPSSFRFWNLGDVFLKVFTNGWWRPARTLSFVSWSKPPTATRLNPYITLIRLIVIVRFSSRKGLQVLISQQPAVADVDQNLTLKSFIEEATNESKRSTLRIRPLGVRGPPRSEVPFLVHTHHTINSTDIYTYNIHRYIYIKVD